MQKLHAQRMYAFVYRGLQVGCHKFATKIRACATFGGDFELKIPRMREFSSQICDNQPANLCMGRLMTLDHL